MQNTKPFKVGSILLATEQGLGFMARDFYRNGIIDKVYVQPHSSRHNNYSWYPDRVSNTEGLLDCDVLFFFETPFDWPFFLKARSKGIKTVIMPMYECSNLPYLPDLILSPSLLDKKYYPGSTYIPVPVDVKWRLRTKAETFVHNAGNGGLGGRNGTKELIEAWQYVKSPARLLIRSQVDIKIPKDERIRVEVGTLPSADLWHIGDVFIFPEKFNGLSLPLQEAFASGMLVMATDRFPNYMYLPTEPLIPVRDYKKEKLSRNQFDSAIVEPRVVAQTVDNWYLKDIGKYSRMGKRYAEENSWTILKEKYLEAIKP